MKYAIVLGLAGSALAKSAASSKRSTMKRDDCRALISSIAGIGALSATNLIDFVDCDKLQASSPQQRKREVCTAYAMIDGPGMEYSGIPDCDILPNPLKTPLGEPILPKKRTYPVGHPDHPGAHPPAPVSSVVVTPTPGVAAPTGAPAPPYPGYVADPALGIDYNLRPKVHRRRRRGEQPWGAEYPAGAAQPTGVAPPAGGYPAGVPPVGAPPAASAPPAPPAASMPAVPAPVVPAPEVPAPEVPAPVVPAPEVPAPGYPAGVPPKGPEQPPTGPSAPPAGGPGYPAGTPPVAGVPAPTGAAPVGPPADLPMPGYPADKGDNGHGYKPWDGPKPHYPQHQVPGAPAPTGGPMPSAPPAEMPGYPAIPNKGNGDHGYKPWNPEQPQPGAPAPTGSYPAGSPPVWAGPPPAGGAPPAASTLATYVVPAPSAQPEIPAEGYPTNNKKREEEHEETFWEKMDPLNWFHNEEKPAEPAEPTPAAKRDVISDFKGWFSGEHEDPEHEAQIN